jgi:RNA polymerase sigma factor (sigma-70 family)
MPKPSAQKAFRQVYDENHAAVLAYCLRRASLEDAKDATAEVFLVAWRRFDDVPGGYALPWLYGTARKVLANQRRSRSRLMRLATRLRVNSPTAPVEPETAVIRREQDQDVLDALGRLRFRDREVIQLTMWEELPQTAIGEILGCSDRAVTMRLHRALNRFRRELSHDKRWINAPALAPETEATND